MIKNYCKLTIVYKLYLWIQIYITPLPGPDSLQVYCIRSILNKFHLSISLKLLVHFLTNILIEIISLVNF